jgi:signal transduction histidine kinase
MPYRVRGQGEVASYWDLTFVPVMNADGYVDGIVSITVDATSRVEAERAHQGRVEAIREMDRLKDDFINTVTHELRTPLTAIMGYCEFLEDHIGGDLTHDQEEFVRQIKEGGDRLKRLVDDLLDFARLEAGTFMLTRREADLAELVREEVEALLPAAAESGHEVVLDLPDVLMALFDPDRVGQVLRNLVGNAIKFTPCGGRLHVRLSTEDGLARVEVEDNGPGIAPTLHSRVFDKFFQAEPSLTRLHGGAGLGLAIAKALVEAQGGRIGFRSAPGSGSVFWFLLPLHPSEDPED